MPTPPPATDVMARLRHMAQQVAAKDARVLTAVDHYLAEFAAYECWAPYIALLEQCLHKKKIALLQHYILLVRAKHCHVQDREGAALSCKRMVADLKLNFSQLARQILPQVLPEGDYAGEAKILTMVAASFHSTADQIACLERLSLLYDKKLPSDELVFELHEKILHLDPRNFKALRYFKTAYSQNGAWNDVSELLHKMLAVASHPAEIYRLGQELASVYLYHLDKPNRAIQVLDTHCQGSPLDCSNLAFDAYLRLRDWQGGLRVLKQLLGRLSEPKPQALVHYRMAQLYSQIGQAKSADEHYQLALRLYPRFLEPMEELIHMAAQENDWSRLKKLLEQLWAMLEGDKEQQLISSLLARIDTALQSSSPGRNSPGS